MRTFVLLLVFAMPPLIACGGAYAKSVADIGKPVCTQFDEAAKIKAVVATATPVAKTAVTNATASATTASAQPGTTAAQGKGGGGAPDSLRTRDAPHWQTFLPGMFR